MPSFFSIFTKVIWHTSGYEARNASAADPRTGVLIREPGFTARGMRSSSLRLVVDIRKASLIFNLEKLLGGSYAYKLVNSLNTAGAFGATEEWLM